MAYGETQDSARTWGGVKRPPVGRVGRCPCHGHGANSDLGGMA